MAMVGKGCSLWLIVALAANWVCGIALYWVLRAHSYSTWLKLGGSGLLQFYQGKAREWVRKGQFLRREEPVGVKVLGLGIWFSGLAVVGLFACALLAN